MIKSHRAASSANRFPCQFPAGPLAGKKFSLLKSQGDRLQGYDYKGLFDALIAFSRLGDDFSLPFSRAAGKPGLADESAKGRSR
jgi:hypothetical protein